MVVSTWLRLLPLAALGLTSAIGVATMATGQPGYETFGAALVFVLVSSAFVLGRMWDDVVQRESSQS